jgi:hypothetical protein
MKKHTCCSIRRKRPARLPCRPHDRLQAGRIGAIRINRTRLTLRIVGTTCLSSYPSVSPAVRVLDARGQSRSPPDAAEFLRTGIKYNGKREKIINKILFVKLHRRKFFIIKTLNDPENFLKENADCRRSSPFVQCGQQGHASLPGKRDGTGWV